LAPFILHSRHTFSSGAIAVQLAGVSENQSTLRMREAAVLMSHTEHGEMYMHDPQLSCIRVTRLPNHNVAVAICTRLTFPSFNPLKPVG
jgi:hypothetical protein